MSDEQQRSGDAPRAEHVPASDREIILTRVYNAPPERVFVAWTEQDRISRWWGPNGFTTTTFEMDVRPGGVWRFVMHGPDGTDYDNWIRYEVVERPRRLIYMHGESEGDPAAFHVTVTFEPVDGKTRITMRTLLRTPEQRAEAEGFGAIELGIQTLEKLATYLAGN
ncbi:MAG TPA: SRPBCC family protein [Longimicrobiales bacterium]|nr:SRPBCC family protein [Longimicrobiales bacterium]